MGGHMPEFTDRTFLHEDNAALIFSPLEFRHLKTKNRLFRSNLSGMFDKYNGYGGYTRLNWEEKFARGGIGCIISSYTPVARARAHPGALRHDRQRRQDRHSGGQVGKRVHRLRLPLHHAAQPLRPAAGHGRRREQYWTAQSSTNQKDYFHGILCQAMTVEEIREIVEQFAAGRAPGPGRGARRRRAARRQRLPDHAIPQLRHQRPQATSTAAASRTGRGSSLRDRPRHPPRSRPRLPPANEDQRRGPQRLAVSLEEEGQHPRRHGQICRMLGGGTAWTPSTFPAAQPSPTRAIRQVTSPRRRCHAGTAACWRQACVPASTQNLQQSNSGAAIPPVLGGPSWKDHRGHQR